MSLCLPETEPFANDRIYSWLGLMKFFSRLEKEQRELSVQKRCEGLKNVPESKCFFRIRKQFL